MQKREAENQYLTSEEVLPGEWKEFKSMLSQPPETDEHLPRTEHKQIAIGIGAETGNTVSKGNPENSEGESILVSQEFASEDTCKTSETCEVDDSQLRAGQEHEGTGEGEVTKAMEDGVEKSDPNQYNLDLAGTCLMTTSFGEQNNEGLKEEIILDQQVEVTAAKDAPLDEGPEAIEPDAAASSPMNKHEAASEITGDAMDEPDNLSIDLSSVDGTAPKLEEKLIQAPSITVRDEQATTESKCLDEDNMQGDAASKGVTGNDPAVEVRSSISIRDEKLENPQVKYLLEATPILHGGDKDYKGEDADERNSNIREEEVHDGSEITCPTEATKEIVKDNDMLPLPQPIEEERLESFRDNENKEEKSEQGVDTECATEKGQNEDIRLESAEVVSDQDFQPDEKDADKFEGEKLEKSEAAAEESIVGETSQAAESPEETPNASMLRQEDKLQIEYKNPDTTEALPEEKGNEEKSFVILAERSSNDIKQGDTDGQNEKTILENEEDSKILQESAKTEDKEDDTGKQSINGESQNEDASPESIGEESHESLQEPKKEEKMLEIEEYEQHETTNTFEDDEKLTHEEEELSDAAGKGAIGNDPSVEVSSSISITDEKLDNFQVKNVPEATPIFSGGDKDYKGDDADERNNNITEEEVHDGPEIIYPLEATKEIIEDNNLFPLPKLKEEERFESFRDNKNKEEKSERGVDTECVTEEGQNEDIRPESAEEVPDQDFQVDEKDADKFEGEKLEKSEAAAEESIAGETSQTAESPQETLNTSMVRQEDKLQFEDKSVDTTEALPEEKGNEEKSFVILAEGSSNDIKHSETVAQNERKILENEEDSKILHESEQGKKLEHSMHPTSEGEIIKDDNLLPLPKLTEEERFERCRDDKNKAEKSEQGDDTERVTKDGQYKDLRPESAEQVLDQSFQVDEKDADKFEGEKLEKSEAAAEESIAGETSHIAESPQETLDTSTVRQEDILQIEYKSADTTEALPEEKGKEEKSFVILAEGSSNDIKQGETEGQNETKILENEEDSKILQKSEQGKNLEHSLHLTSEETERMPSEADKIPTLLEGVVQNPQKTLGDEEKVTEAIDNKSIEEKDTTKEDLKPDTETSDASKESVISEQEIKAGEMVVEAFTKAYKLDSQEKTEYEDVMKDMEVNTKKEDTEEVHEGAKIEDKEEDTGASILLFQVHDGPELICPLEATKEIIEDNNLLPLPKLKEEERFESFRDNKNKEEKSEQGVDTECVTEEGQNEDIRPESTDEVPDQNFQVDEKDADKFEGEKLEKSEAAAEESIAGEPSQTAEGPQETLNTSMLRQEDKLQLEYKSVDTTEDLPEEKGNEEKSFVILAEGSSNDIKHSEIVAENEKKRMEKEEDSKILQESEQGKKLEHSMQPTPEGAERIPSEADKIPSLMEGVAQNPEKTLGDEEKVTGAIDNKSIEEKDTTKEDLKLDTDTSDASKESIISEQEIRGGETAVEAFTKAYKLDSQEKTEYEDVMKDMEVNTKEEDTEEVQEGAKIEDKEEETKLEKSEAAAEESIAGETSHIAESPQETLDTSTVRQEDILQIDYKSADTTEALPEEKGKEEKSFVILAEGSSNDIKKGETEGQNEMKILENEEDSKILQESEQRKNLEHSLHPTSEETERIPSEADKIPSLLEGVVQNPRKTVGDEEKATGAIDNNSIEENDTIKEDLKLYTQTPDASKESIISEQEIEVGEMEVEEFTMPYKLDSQENTEYEDVMKDIEVNTRKEEAEVHEGAKIEDKEEDTGDQSINDESQNEDASPGSTEEESHESLQEAKKEEKMPEVEVHEQLETTNTLEDAEILTLEEEEISDAAGKGATGNDPSVELSSSISIKDEKVEHDPATTPILSGVDKDDKGEDADERNIYITEEEVHEGPETICHLETTKEIIKDNNLLPMPKQTEEERFESFRDDKNKAEKSEEGDDTEYVTIDGQNEDLKPESAEEVPDQSFQVDKKDADKFEGEKLEKSETAAGESIPGETSQTAESPQETFNTSMVRQEDKLQIEYESADTTEALPEEKGNEEESFVIPAEASSNDIKQGETEGQNENKILKNEEDSKILQEGEQRRKLEHSLHLTSEKTERIPSEADKIPSLMEEVVQNPGKTLGDEEKAAGAIDNNSIEENDTAKEDLKLDTETSDASKKSIISEQELQVGAVEVEAFTKAYKLDSQEKTEYEDVMKDIEVNTKKEEADEVHEGAKIEDMEEDTGEQSINDKSQNGDASPESIREESHESLQEAKNEEKMPEIEVHEQLETTSTFEDAEKLTLEEEEISDAASKGAAGKDPSVEVSSSISIKDEKVENLQVKNDPETTPILSEGDKDYKEEDADERNINITEEEVLDGPETICHSETTKEITKDNNLFPLPKQTEEERFESCRDDKIKAEKLEQGDDTEYVRKDGQNEDHRPESAEEVLDQSFQVDEKDADKFDGEKLEKSEAAAEESIAGETSQTAESPQETLNTSMVRQEDKLQIECKSADTTEALPEEKGNEEESFVIQAEGSSNDIKQGETEGQNENKILKNEEDSKILQESEQEKELEHSLHLTLEEAERIPSEADKIPSLMEGVVQNPEKPLGHEEKATGAIDNNSIEENDTAKEDLKLDNETSDASKEKIISEQDIKVSEMEVEALTKAYKLDSQEKTEYEDVMEDIEVNPKKEEAEEVHEGAKIEDKEEDTGEQSINDESQNGDASPESIGEESYESLQEAKKEEMMPEIEVHEQLETANTFEDAEKLKFEEDEISDAASKGATVNDPSVEVGSSISIIDEKLENFQVMNVLESTPILSGGDRDYEGEDADERNNNVMEEEVHDGPEIICPSEANKEITKDNYLLPLPKLTEEERFESCRDDENKAEKSEQRDDTECVTKDGQNEDLRPESAEEFSDQSFQVDEKDADKFDGEKLEKSEVAAEESIASDTSQVAESPPETLDTSMMRQEDKLPTECKSADTTEALPEEKGNEEKSFVILAEGSSNDIKQGETEGQNEKRILENEEESKILQESEQGKKLEHSLQLTSEEAERIPSEADKIPSLVNEVVHDPGKTLGDEEKVTVAIDNNSIEENDTTKEDLKLDAETPDASKKSIISEQETKVGELEEEAFAKAYELDSQERTEYEDVMKDIEVNTKKEESEVHDGGKIEDKEEDTEQSVINDESHNGDASPESIEEESYENPQEAKKEEKMPEIEVHEQPKTTNTSEEAESLMFEEEEISKHQSPQLADKMEEGSNEENAVQTVKEKEVYEAATTANSGISKENLGIEGNDKPGLFSSTKDATVEEISNKDKSSPMNLKEEVSDSSVALKRDIEETGPLEETTPQNTEDQPEQKNDHNPLDTTEDEIEEDPIQNSSFKSEVCRDTEELLEKERTNFSDTESTAAAKEEPTVREVEHEDNTEVGGSESDLPLEEKGLAATETKGVDLDSVDTDVEEDSTNSFEKDKEIPTAANEMQDEASNSVGEDQEEVTTRVIPLKEILEGDLKEISEVPLEEHGLVSTEAREINETSVKIQDTCETSESRSISPGVEEMLTQKEDNLSNTIDIPLLGTVDTGEESVDEIKKHLGKDRHLHTEQSAETYISKTKDAEVSDEEETRDEGEYEKPIDEALKCIEPSGIIEDDEKDINKAENSSPNLVGSLKDNTDIEKEATRLERSDQIREINSVNDEASQIEENLEPEEFDQKLKHETDSKNEDQSNETILDSSKSQKEENTTDAQNQEAENEKEEENEKVKGEIDKNSIRENDTTKEDLKLEAETSEASKESIISQHDTKVGEMELEAFTKTNKLDSQEKTEHEDAMKDIEVNTRKEEAEEVHEGAKIEDKDKDTEQSTINDEAIGEESHESLQEAKTEEKMPEIEVHEQLETTTTSDDGEKLMFVEEEISKHQSTRLTDKMEEDSNEENAVKIMTEKEENQVTQESKDIDTQKTSDGSSKGANNFDAPARVTNKEESLEKEDKEREPEKEVHEADITPDSERGMENLGIEENNHPDLSSSTKDEVAEGKISKEDESSPMNLKEVVGGSSLAILRNIDETGSVEETAPLTTEDRPEPKNDQHPLNITKEGNKGIILEEMKEDLVQNSSFESEVCKDTEELLEKERSNICYSESIAAATEQTKVKEADPEDNTEVGGSELPIEEIGLAATETKGGHLDSVDANAREDSSNSFEKEKEIPKAANEMQDETSESVGEDQKEVTTRVAPFKEILEGDLKENSEVPLEELGPKSTEEREINETSEKIRDSCETSESHSISPGVEQMFMQKEQNLYNKIAVPLLGTVDTGEERVDEIKKHAAEDQDLHAEQSTETYIFKTKDAEISGGEEIRDEGEYAKPTDEAAKCIEPSGIREDDEKDVNEPDNSSTNLAGSLKDNIDVENEATKLERSNQINEVNNIIDEASQIEESLKPEEFDQKLKHEAESIDEDQSNETILDSNNSEKEENIFDAENQEVRNEKEGSIDNNSIEENGTTKEDLKLDTETSNASKESIISQQDTKVGEMEVEAFTNAYKLDSQEKTEYENEMEHREVNTKNEEAEKVHESAKIEDKEEDTEQSIVNEEYHIGDTSPESIVEESHESLEGAKTEKMMPEIEVREQLEMANTLGDGEQHMFVDEEISKHQSTQIPDTTEESSNEENALQIMTEKGENQATHEGEDIDTQKTKDDSSKAGDNFNLPARVTDKGGSLVKENKETEPEKEVCEADITAESGPSRENLGKIENDEPDLSSSTKDEIVEEISKEDETCPINLKEVISDSSSALVRDIEETGSVVEITPQITEDRPDPKNDQGLLDITEEGKEEIILEETVEDLVQKSSFKSEVCKDTEELLETERTNISDSESIVAAIEETKIKEAEPEDNTKVGGSDLSLEERGLAATETKEVNLDNVDINVKKDSSNSFEKDEEIPSAENEMQDKTSNSVKEVTTKDASLKEILEDDLKKNFVVPLKEHSSTSNEAREINETSVKIQDPCETSETHSISPGLEEMLQKADNLSNPIAVPLLEIVDTGEESVDEIKKHTGEDRDLHTEQSTETYISKTKDAEVSKGKETREEGEHEKPIDEDVKCIEPSGIREDGEKDIDKPDNYYTNLVGSLKDDTDIVKEDIELERSNQIHDVNNINDEALQTEENLEPEEFDQKLKHVPESMDEDQSNETIIDSNKSQKGENTIDIQYQEAENEKEGETETELKSEDPIDKEQSENELNKAVILSKEVDEEVRKVDDSENIKEHVKEEECSRNNFLMASIGDKTMHKVKDYSPISTECVEGAEFKEPMNAESTHMRHDPVTGGEVSHTTKELEEREHDGNGEMPLTKFVEQGEESEEKINKEITAESDICHNQTDTAPLTTVEADISLRSSELDDKIENTLNVGSDNANPETTKSDANQESNEVENDKLQATSSDLASRISTSECESKATKDKTEVIDRDVGADYISREQSAKETDKAEKSPTVENLDGTVETSHTVELGKEILVSDAIYKPQDKGTEEKAETRKSPNEETAAVLESQFAKQDDIAFDKALPEEKSEEELQTPFSRLPSDNKEIGTITIEKEKEEQEEDKEMLETGSPEDFSDFSDAKTSGDVCLRNEEQREPKAVSEEDITVCQVFPAEKSEEKIQTTSSVLPSEGQEYRTANMAGKTEYDERKQVAILMDQTPDDYSDANKKEEGCFQGPTNLETVTGDDITTGQSLTENKLDEQIKTTSSAILFKEQESEAAVTIEKIEEEETAGTGILEGGSPEDSCDAKKTEEIHLQQEEPQELEGDWNYETVAAQSPFVEKSNEEISAPSSTLPYEDPKHGTKTKVDDMEEERMKKEEGPTEIGAVIEKEIIAGQVLPAEESDANVNTKAVGKEKEELEDSSSTVREEIIVSQVLPGEETEENGNTKAVEKEEGKLEAEINEDSSKVFVKHEPTDSQKFAAEKPRQQVQEEEHETMIIARKIEDDKKQEAEIIEDDNADPAESVKDLCMKEDSTEAETFEENEIAANQTSKEEKSEEQSQIAISALPSDEQECEGATTVENTNSQNFSAETSEKHVQEEKHEAAITAKKLEDDQKEEVAIIEDESAQDDKDSKTVEDLCLQKDHIEPKAVPGDENTPDQAPMEKKAEEQIQIAISTLPSKEEEGEGAMKVENTNDWSILADKSEQLVQEKDNETGIIGEKIEGNIIEEAETIEDKNTEDSSDSKTMKGLSLQKESTEPDAVIESETTENQTLEEEKSEEQIQIAIPTLPSNEQKGEGLEKVEDTDGQTFSPEKSEEQHQEEEHKLGINAKKTEDDKKEEVEIVEDKGENDASDSNTMKDFCLQKESMELEAVIEHETTADQAIMKQKSEEQIQTAIPALHSKEQEFEGATTVENMDGQTFPAEKSEQQLQEEGHEAVIIGKTEDNKKEQAETIEDVSARDASDSETMKDLCPQKQSTKPEAIIENESTADQTAVKEKSEEEIQIANSALPSKEMEIEGATTVEDFEEQKINEAELLEDENQEYAVDAKEAEDVLLGKGTLQELEAVRKEEILFSQKREEAEIIEYESAEDASDAKKMRDLCLQKESPELDAALENKTTVDQTVVEEKLGEKIQIATSALPSKEKECKGATTVENIEEEKTKEAEILEDENQEDLLDAEKAEDILLQNERLQESEAVRKDQIESDQTLLTEKQLPTASSTMSSEEQEHGSTSKVNEEEKTKEVRLEKDSSAGKPKEKGAEDIFLAKEMLQELEGVGKDEITFAHTPVLAENIQTPSSALPLEEEKLGTTTRSEDLGEGKLKEEEVLERKLSEVKSTEDKFSEKKGPKELEDVPEEEIIAEQALQVEESWENETKRSVQKLQEQKMKEEEKLEDESCENPPVETKTKVTCFQMEEPNKLEAVAKDKTAAGQTFSVEHSEELQILAPALSLEDKWKTIQGDEPKKNGDSKEIMEDKEVAQTFHQTSLSEESAKASDQEDQLKVLGNENNATFKTTTNRIQNEELLEETQKVNANNNDEEILAEDRSIKEPDNNSSVVMTATTPVRKEESGVAISEKGSTKCLGEAIEIIHDVQQIEKMANEASDKQTPRKVELVESTGTTASTGNELAQLEKKDVVAETSETAEVRDLEPGKDKGIYAERKEGEHGGVKKTEAIEEPTPAEDISLANLLQKSRKETLQMAKEMTEARHPTASKEKLKVEEAETIQVKEAKTDEEKEDREERNKHEKMDSDPDSPIMVEAPRDISIKVAHKKSHSILSGVGSKVKHSISKVKKAFSCASPQVEKLSEKLDEHKY
ncbi:hypothetical protein SLEP1_g19500 [Rubroshorea leprosula]|uniref:Titin-like n=1 Tax=Rubroshorea leprosula TaxID=152421 RepID=A0AAV5IZJ9_9ROSI|nr:hypothetical protein SLEP1_g19500 [Rubroshorea leprosula]